MGKLTTRQYKLYTLLEANSKVNPKMFITKEEIVKAILEYEYNPNQSDVNQTAYRQLRADKLEINCTECEDLPLKLIISSKEGYRLMTDTEFDSWKIHEKAKILRRLKTYNIMKRRGEKNNQGKLVEDESRAKPFVETLIHVNEDIQ